jgi:intracellular sulfur oxidation DsrE/DsrF family protein
MIRRNLIRFFTVAAMLAVGGAPLATAQAAEKERIVLQVSDDNPKTWTQALNVVRNIQKERGKDNVEIEVVVFGLGAGMLKADSTLANRVDDTLASGANILMCENTMRGFKLEKKDMHPKIGYVPGGIIRIMDRSKEGWTIVRP